MRDFYKPITCAAVFLALLVLVMSYYHAADDMTAIETPSIDDVALKLACPVIKKHEGLMLNAYADGSGYSIGYGHHGAAKGDTITESQADKILDQDMIRAAAIVKRNVEVELTAGQYAALISWVFNFGEGAFMQSTLLKVINSGELEAVPGEIKRWRYQVRDGVKTELPGLVSRREAEVVLWNN